MPLSFLLFTSSQIHTTIYVDWFTTGGKQPATLRMGYTRIEHLADSEG